MEKIEIDGKTYEVVDRYETTDIHTSLTQFEMVETTTNRNRTFFAWLPLLIDGKFHWLKRATASEVLHFSRILQFDDGWGYRFYWGDWKEKWVMEKIID